MPWFLALCLLIPPLHPTGPLPGTADALLLARIAVAEAGGAGIWGSPQAAAEAQVAVMWVVRNRMGERLSVRDVAYGFSTGKRLLWPGMGPYMAALSILRLPLADAPYPYHYVISEQDRECLHFPQGDLVLRASPTFALHFYTPESWP